MSPLSFKATGNWERVLCAKRRPILSLYPRTDNYITITEINKDRKALFISTRRVRRMGE